MNYHLSERFVLRWLENPSLYDPGNDELYELDDSGFRFLQSCASTEGCDAAETDCEFLDYCLSEGILDVASKTLKRPPVIKSPIPSLRYLELQITDRCNLRCRHCYIGESRNKELPMAALKSVLDEFEHMQGLRLLITGGEPLMHRHFNEFNELLPSYGFRKVLLTNGLLLNKRIIDLLNVDEIQFSVDGMEYGHDATRGEGTFQKVMKIVAETLGAGMTVSISTMVHQENLAEFDEMEKLFRGLGVKDWTVDVPCAEGSLKNNDILQVTPEIGGRYLDYGFGGGLHGGTEGFGCGLHLAAVMAGGDICKCAFYSGEPAGNISEGLGKAWERIEPVDLNSLECALLSCRRLDECRGGCRYRASVISGNQKTCNYTCRGFARDLYKCFQYGIIK